MNLGKLRINQLTAQAWDWYQDYLAALDAYDIDRYATFLADDVRVQFNNSDPMTGLKTATAGLSQFWGSITAMNYTLMHEPLNIYGTDETFVLEALNHYDTPDGHRITIRAVAFTDRRGDGKVSSVRIYQDLSPLYAPAPEQSPPGAVLMGSPPG